MLSASQVRRRFGIELLELTERELSEFDLHVFAVEGITTFKGPVRLFNFVAGKPLDYLEASGQIIHQVGTAEMRLLLGSPRTWEAAGGALAATERPDALWHREDGTCAIEYDTGSYSAQRVAEKIKAFSSYQHTYWGCSSQARVRTLSARYRTHPRLSFFHVAWWL